MAGSLLTRAGDSQLDANQADVGQSRERSRRRRLAALSGLLLIPASYLWARLLTGNPFDIFNITWPQIDLMILMPVLFFVSLIVFALWLNVQALDARKAA